MPDILLTHSFLLKYDNKQAKLGQPWPPLGSLYAASMLASNNFDFYFYDSTFSSDPDEIIPVIENGKPSILIIYDDCFNYLSKMCLTNIREAALRMISIGKQSGCKVIVCSSDANDQYEMYLNHGADFIIIGEGEITLVELLKQLISKEEPGFEEIKGIAWISPEGIKVNRQRDVISDMDELPFPAWELLDIEKYRTTWMNRNGYFMMNMVTTRGCPFHCIWCAKPVYGNGYNSRSPENAVKEMIQIRTKYKPTAIWFADDIFGLKPGWIEEFSHQIVSNNVHIPFTIQSRVDLLLNDNQIKLLAQSGCTKIWLGIESGSQKILDAMNKGITIEQVYSASERLRKSGMEFAFFLQLGFPGETRDDINKTIRLITDLMPDDIGISITYPLPGTLLFEKVKQDLINKSNWSDSDELKLMFKNNFSAAFYKTLHRYIHKYFRFRQGAHYYRQLICLHPETKQIHLKRMLLLPYYLFFALVFKIKLKSIEFNAR